MNILVQKEQSIKIIIEGESFLLTAKEAYSLECGLADARKELQDDIELAKKAKENNF
ncbi:hypothetical protein LCGC14_2447660 [marine sediment metagenome]|uniref:Uncharacterized protein n=1 Tax=marine sediment metagenome TaxID=412755 RepID=A0A0F9BHD7_9ZZZZ